MNSDSRHPQVTFPPPVAYGPLQLPSRYLLSPLAGYTNLAFRRIVRQIGGVGLATTDLISANALVHLNEKTQRMIETHPEDRPFAVQIFGHEAPVMVDAAKMLEERGTDSIDINMGCPVNKIAGGGSGAGMMCDMAGTLALVQAVVDAVRIPVSVKMRLGWDSTQLTAPQFAREFEQIGVCAVAIHGRTREQGFSGSVDLNGIRSVAEAVDSIPVVGNGDVRTIEDAARMLNETGCDGVSIGRGALANPWIFRQLAQWEATGSYDPPGSFNDRLELLLRQFGYMIEQWGEHGGIVRFRKMAHWYLKSMRVRAGLRHQFQQAKTREQFDAAVAAIVEAGPIGGNRTGLLPDMHIPVPSGPVERW
ncbi:MAG: tRNA dihydrouridine synthase DusB [Planctomycetota bacterium]|jgi:nifR3 family TIM-barrel protein